MQIVRVGTWGDYREADRVTPTSPFYKANPPYAVAVPGGRYGGENIWYGESWYPVCVFKKRPKTKCFLLGE